MKKYKFRLQTILNMKEKILEEKMLELSKVLNIYNAEQDKLANLEKSRIDSTETLARLYSQNLVLDISEVQLHKNYLAKVTTDIRQQHNVLENIRKLVEIKQNEVNAALKEKKIFEKLKEKEQNKFYKEVEAKERFEVDDMAISRYVRK